MKTPGRPTYAFWQIFRWPFLIGLSSSIGLVSALVGDGPWDALSWATLVAPLAVIAWFFRAMHPRFPAGLRGNRGRFPGAEGRES
ncbi:MAG: hypothetical protein LBF93_10190 [Zoogloeaceae bacterium]|jgi:hypothetical protein|nr:hypothetical protein [Zoogloeaceae bacterium]